MMLRRINKLLSISYIKKISCSFYRAIAWQMNKKTNKKNFQQGCHRLSSERSTAMSGIKYPRKLWAPRSSAQPQSCCLVDDCWDALCRLPVSASDNRLTIACTNTRKQTKSSPRFYRPAHESSLASYLSALQKRNVVLVFALIKFGLSRLFSISFPCPPPLSLTLTHTHTMQKQYYFYWSSYLSLLIETSQEKTC